MSNESINGFTKPVSVILNDLPDLSENMIEKGQISSDITVYELHTFGILFKLLELENLTELASYQTKLTVGCYERIKSRMKTQQPARQLIKRINTLTKIIDNTLDDLETIYKETGLDSVGVLIENVRGER